MREFAEVCQDRKRRLLLALPRPFLQLARDALFQTRGDFPLEELISLLTQQQLQALQLEDQGHPHVIRMLSEAHRIREMPPHSDHQPSPHRNLPQLPMSAIRPL